MRSHSVSHESLRAIRSSRTDDTEGDGNTIGRVRGSKHSSTPTKQFLNLTSLLSSPWCNSIGMGYNESMSKKSYVLGISCEDFVGENNKLSRHEALESELYMHVDKIDYLCCVPFPEQEPSQTPLSVNSSCENDLCVESITPTMFPSGIPSGNSVQSSTSDEGLVTTTIIVSGDIDEDNSNFSPEILVMASAFFAFFSFKSLKRAYRKMVLKNDQGAASGHDVHASCIEDVDFSQFEHIPVSEQQRQSSEADDADFSRFEHIPVPEYEQQNHTRSSEPDDASFSMFEHVQPWLP